MFSAQWSTAARSAPALGSIQTRQHRQQVGGALGIVPDPAVRAAFLANGVSAEAGGATPLTGVTVAEAERPRGVHRAAAAAAPAI